jgi:hypothetical protein
MRAAVGSVASSFHVPDPGRSRVGREYITPRPLRWHAQERPLFTLLQIDGDNPERTYPNHCSGEENALTAKLEIVGQTPAAAFISPASSS